MEDLDRPEEALKSYETVIDLEGDNLKAWLLKGELLHKLDRHEEALDSYDRGLDHAEGGDTRVWGSSIWNSRGAVLRDLERYEKSLDSYRRALELNETDVEALRGKGTTLDQMGRFEEALEAYSRIIELDATDVQARKNKGLALWELGRYEEALEAFEQALEYDENNIGIWLGKGVVLGKLGRHEEALGAFEQALQIDETIAAVWRNKGAALQRLGRYEKAVDALQRALEIDSEQQLNWRTLLRLYTEHLDQPDEALELAESYLEAFDYLPDALDFVGWSFFRAGWPDHLPQAEAWTRKAVDQDPDNENYRHTLASILSAKGEWNEAFDHASVFLESPDVVEELLDVVINFFVAAAAAGRTQEALQYIQESPSAETLEPMVVALKMDQGQEVTVAAEVKEVASDVLDRIEAHRQDRSN